MLVVETIAKIRREHDRGKPIKAIMREMGLSRNTVRKAIRAESAQFSYRRAARPRPQLGAFAERLDGFLEQNERAAKRDRLRLSRIHDLLQRDGFAGSYDAVRRYAARWKRERRGGAAVDPEQLYIPLSFAPGEAYQFDWSHEDFEIAGVPMRVKVAHMRLCWSRMAFRRIYPRETQEMVFDAHISGFDYFGGVPLRGIYDNMKTAVTTVFAGKERVFNRRFLVMMDHHRIEPVACTPAAGWEKGQVENQVQNTRESMFKPRPRFASIDEANAWLFDESLRQANKQAHPDLAGMTVAQAFELERAALRPLGPAFDGFFESDHVASSTCLVSFDRNRYSVMAKAGRMAVQVRAYATRIVIRCGDEVVAEHPRLFGRDQVTYDPWHYIPILARKPGALRNGAPFMDWPLPPGLSGLRKAMGKGNDADRRFVRVLAQVPEEGLEAVEAAIIEALHSGVCSDEVILNILSRRRRPPPPEQISVLTNLHLAHPPKADCARYDQARGFDAAA